MADRQWFYFGCRNGPGHYLFNQSGGQALRRGVAERLTNQFDGSLAPYPESAEVLYRASLTRLGGLGYSALAWWDRSVDKRPASNSVIFAPDLEIGFQDMLDEAKRRFPWVFDRTPQPVTIKPWAIVPEQDAA